MTKSRPWMLMMSGTEMLSGKARIPEIVPGGRHGNAGLLELVLVVGDAEREEEQRCAVAVLVHGVRIEVLEIASRSRDRASAGTPASIAAAVTSSSRHTISNGASRPRLAIILARKSAGLAYWNSTLMPVCLVKRSTHISAAPRRTARQTTRPAASRPACCAVAAVDTAARTSAAARMWCRNLHGALLCIRCSSVWSRTAARGRRSDRESASR